MLKLTKDQQRAVKRVQERGEHGGTMPPTYRELHKRLRPTFGMDGAVVLPWAGMFLLIERDGYTHS